MSWAGGQEICDGEHFGAAPFCCLRVRILTVPFSSSFSRPLREILDPPIYQLPKNADVGELVEIAVVPISIEQLHLCAIQPDATRKVEEQ
jgi:hypothetical protein